MRCLGLHGRQRAGRRQGSVAWGTEGLRLRAELARHDGWSAGAAEGVSRVARLFDETSLSASERQVVLLAVSATNGCEYCLAAHTTIASMQGVPAATIAAARDGRRVDDARIEALRLFATAVTARRGHPTDQELEAFRAAGYSDQQVLEVVLGVGMKTLSNYTNHLAGAPVDAIFAGGLAAQA